VSVTISNRPMPLGALVAGIGGAAAVIAGFLAWESVSVLGISESVVGLEANGGKLVALLGIGAIAVAFAWVTGKISQPATAAIVIGVLAFLIGVLNFFTVNDDVSTANAILPGAASIGIGLYLAIVAGAAIAVGGALGMRKTA
jgi:hypothetical protein